MDTKIAHGTMYKIFFKNICFRISYLTLYANRYVDDGCNHAIITPNLIRLIEY
jgi:hypothetical protein